MVTFVKLATKLMAVRNRSCMSIYGLIAMRERLGANVFWRQRDVEDDAMASKL